MRFLLIMENIREILRGNEFKKDGATDEFNSSDDRRVGGSGSSVSPDVAGIGFWQVDATVGEAVFGFGS